MASCSTVQAIRIGQNTWTVGETVRTVGSKVFKRNILEPVFGAEWKTVLIEGKFAGHGGTRKYRIEWTSFNPPLVEEYGAQHGIFKKPGNVYPNVPTGENITDPLADEECAETESDFDSSDEEEEERIDTVDEERVAVGGRIWYSNPALDGRDPRPMQDIITLAPRLPDFNPANNKPLVFFNRFFPIRLKRLMVDCTNSNFRSNQRHVDIAEIDQFMGVLLAMCVNPAACIDEYWSLEDNGFKPAKRFKEKTGMSKNRWEEIRSALGFWEGNGDFIYEKEKEDEWYRVRKLFELWNENMDNSFIASDTMVCDECMCRWLADDFYGPSVTKMPLKPEGVGFLIKAAACGRSRIIFGMELQESPSAMDKKEFSMHMMKPTACTLRLVKPYFGTKRCVVGDSWFASVPCAIELLKRGLYFTGIVKGRSSEFPKTFFHESAFDSDSKRGETRTLHSNTEYGAMMAHCWYEPGPDKPSKPGRPRRKKRIGNKKMKCFVSTAHSALPDQPWPRLRRLKNTAGVIVQHTLHIPQTHIVREYFSTANAIDIHNQYGQSLLAIEKIWKVADWWKRLFQFILRVSVVNSYLACRYFQDKPDTFLMDFVDDLASELCWPKRQSPSPKRRKSIEWQASSKVCSMESVKEMFPSINSKGSGRCKVVGPNGQPCGAEAYYFCRKCSVFRDEQKPKLFYVCGARTVKQCGCKYLQSSTQLNAQEE